jgi:hypothetical protein
MASCKQRPTSAAPFCQSYVSENPETSASTIPESIVSLRLPLLLPNKVYRPGRATSRHAFDKEFQPAQQDTHSRNMHNGILASELEPEAMCLKASGMTSSKYRCAGHMLRVHVSAMYRHVHVLCWQFRFELQQGVCGRKAPLRAARRQARAVAGHACQFPSSCKTEICMQNRLPTDMCPSQKKR